VPGLDGLRGLSIACVLVYHAFGSPGFQPPARLWIWFRYLGELGVRVFFVLSGWLITGLLLREIERDGTIALRRFYGRRAMRLFPAFYAMLGVVALLEATGLLQLHPGDLLHAATYTLNYQLRPSWWLVHCWSLAVEEQFYLLWPALLLLLGVRRAVGGAALFVVVSPVVRAIAWKLFPSQREIIGSTGFGTTGDNIAAGCVLAGGKAWLDASRIYQRFIHGRGAVLAPVGLAAGYAMHVVSLPLRVTVAPTLMIVSIAACVDYVLRHPRSASSRARRSWPSASVATRSTSGRSCS
jgi:peptidoglycan/LPS O-acetylase OafA/YrhL